LVWFETDPMYVFHFANAHEEGDEIVVYGCPKSELKLGQVRNPNSKDWFARWTFNLKTKQVRHFLLLEDPH